jgi:hypothetical protein
LVYARAIALAIIIDTLSQFCRFASFSCIITTQLHIRRQKVVSKRQIFLYTHTRELLHLHVHMICMRSRERERANSSLTSAAREFEHNELQRERDNRAVKGGAKVCTYTREFQAKCIVPVSSATALHIFAFYQNTGRVFIPLVSGTKFV